MKKQMILLSIIYLGCSLPTVVSAAIISNIEPDEIVHSSDDASVLFRTKRQHEEHTGYNPLSGIFGTIFNKKLGLLGSLSSVSSSSSSSGNHLEHVHEYSHGYEYVHAVPDPFDWHSFKKTILASLLQAIKAITGGLIALNGQLVKVKGHLMTAKGHLLTTKGDKMTAFGRHLAINAFASPHETHHIDIHESVPLAPSSSAYGVSGPAAVSIHSPSETVGFPSHHFISHLPQAYYKKYGGGYVKRAAPFYYVIDDVIFSKNHHHQ